MDDKQQAYQQAHEVLGRHVHSVNAIPSDIRVRAVEARLGELETHLYSIGHAVARIERMLCAKPPEAAGALGTPAQPYCGNTSWQTPVHDPNGRRR
jgi:hypothetical protein